MLDGPVFHIPPVFDYLEVVGQLSEMTDMGMAKARVPERWGTTLGEDVSVCVLDTGVDLSHPDLKVADAQDFTGGRNPIDRQRHGTHVSGTINMQHNGMLGRGVAPAAKLYVGKVLDDFGTGLEAYIVRGIQWATQNKFDLLNLSLGSPQVSQRILAALEEYVKGGGIPVAAAGNDGRGTANWPAAAEFVVAVGATDAYGRPAPFSSWGDQVDIAACGTDIVSTVPGGGMAKMSGTSMASPLVCGILALAKAYHKKLGDKAKTPLASVYDALALLKARAAKFPDPNTKRFGYGLIDADSMLSPNDPAPVPVEPPGRKVLVSVPALGIEIRQASPDSPLLEIGKLG